jgi:hypothetical protein
LVDTNFAEDGLEWAVVLPAEHFRLEAVPGDPAA